VVDANLGARPGALSTRTGEANADLDGMMSPASRSSLITCSLNSSSEIEERYGVAVGIANPSIRLIWNCSRVLDSFLPGPGFPARKALTSRQFLKMVCPDSLHLPQS